MSVRIKNQASFLRIMPEKERDLLVQFRNNIITSIIESQTSQDDDTKKTGKRCGRCNCSKGNDKKFIKRCCPCLEFICCKKIENFVSGAYKIIQSNIGLLLLLTIYACLGALVFSYLEAEEDANVRNNLLVARRWFLTSLEDAWEGRMKKYSGANPDKINPDSSNKLIIYDKSESQVETDLGSALVDKNETWVRLSAAENETSWLGRQTPNLKLVSSLLKQYENYIGQLPVQITKYSSSSVMKEWSFFESLFFCGTVITTIGYGNVTPITKYGRIATMIYGCIGIPLCLIFLSRTGKNLTKAIKFLWSFIRRFYYTGSCKKVRRMVPLNKVKTEFVFQKLNEYLTYNGGKRKSKSWNVTSQQIVTGTSQQTMPLSVDIDIEKQQPQQKLQLLSVQRQRSTYDNNPQQQQLIRQEPSQPSKSSSCFGNKDEKDEEDEIVLPYAVDDNFNLPPIVALAIAFVYIFLGAFIYTRWENWDYLESFYFTFISLSTIGFGDVTPDHPKFFLASFVYILLGLSLIAMVINVIMEAVNATITKASDSVFNFRKKVRGEAAETTREFKVERRMSV